jgi:hypothetical protein
MPTPIVLISEDQKNINRIEFNRVCDLLNNQRNIITKIKSEISSLRGKFDSMFEILPYYPDQITAAQKQLYDVQTQAFIHAVYMCLGIRDSNGVTYVMPVTETDKTTTVILSTIFPHGSVSETVAIVDNLSVSIDTWVINMGVNTINALHSAEIETQFATSTEIFLKSEFINGIVAEIKKLIYFSSIVCKNEQIINAALRYINELKNLGIV